MKNVFKTFLFLMVMVLCLSAASAQGVNCAGKLVEEDDLLHYPSYVHDEDTGKWSVHAYQADALLDRFWDYGMRYSSRTVVFHLAAEGDARTGVWSPVLRFYQIDGERIDARAVSILVDGKRYDLAASSEMVARERHSAECITVPLNREGLQVAAAMQQSESVTVRLIGEKHYQLEINRDEDAERLAIEGESLAQLDAGMALLRELGAESYDLWNLSDERWQQMYGYQPAVTVGTAGESLYGAELDEPTGLVVPGDSGDAAEMVQEKLIESGFLSGKAGSKITDNVEEAILRAQIYLDRVPTGCADEALLAALEAGRSVPQKDAPEMLPLGEKAEICLDRYWFARGVSASADMESLRTVVNTDNAFLVADGLIRNLSGEELHLFMQAEASVVCNENHVYEAELVCECSNETVLDTQLLPMAEARLIVYAEIPAQLAADPQARWSVSFELADADLVIDLE